ncbi:MAG: nucleoside-triphosphatase [Planctomycetota bacterium]
MAVTILSAGRGEGKTTFLRRYAARVAVLGRSVGGIASPAVFEHNQRIGYDLLDLRSGRRRRLARWVTSGEGPPTVGAYRFDEAAIAEGNAAIVAAVRDSLEVIAIDEVGPLELRGEGWTPALEIALRESDLERELLIVVRPALVDELARRFLSPLWAAARRVGPPWPMGMLGE